MGWAQRGIHCAIRHLMLLGVAATMRHTQGLDNSGYQGAATSCGPGAVPASRLGASTQQLPTSLTCTGGPSSVHCSSEPA